MIRCRSRPAGTEQSSAAARVQPVCPCPHGAAALGTGRARQELCGAPGRRGPFKRGPARPAQLCPAPPCPGRAAPSAAPGRSPAARGRPARPGSARVSRSAVRGGAGTAARRGGRSRSAAASLPALPAPAEAQPPGLRTHLPGRPRRGAGDTHLPSPPGRPHLRRPPHPRAGRVSRRAGQGMAGR